MTIFYHFNDINTRCYPPAALFRPEDPLVGVVVDPVYPSYLAAYTGKSPTHHFCPCERWECPKKQGILRY